MDLSFMDIHDIHDILHTYTSITLFLSRCEFLDISWANQDSYKNSYKVHGVILKKILQQKYVALIWIILSR